MKKKKKKSVNFSLTKQNQVLLEKDSILGDFKTPPRPWHENMHKIPIPF